MKESYYRQSDYRPGIIPTFRFSLHIHEFEPIRENINRDWYYSIAEGYLDYNQQINGLIKEERVTKWSVSEAFLNDLVSLLGKRDFLVNRELSFATADLSDLEKGYRIYMHIEYYEQRFRHYYYGNPTQLGLVPSLFDVSQFLEVEGLMV